jgi:lipopolysaccharide/colanic/teichoic acid biosynthesis glycosyltransferase
MSQQQDVIDRFDEKIIEKTNRVPHSKSSHSVRQRILKRSVDIIASLMFFLLFGWLYVLLWVCVLVTTGRPAIFKHPRVGRDGEEFNCLKFRSMVVNSEEILHQYLDENADARAEWERDFKLRNDPRITGFGQFIRKTSLDELPQFWNVLRGDMSLVGPRPVVSKELKQYYGADAIFYNSVKPGITGPWQVGGRNDLDYNERIKLDVEYAKSWRNRGDALILLKTIYVVLAKKGSY